MSTTFLPFTTLETPRLLLRHFRADDVASMLAYRQDPEVARYQGWEADTETEANVRERLEELSQVAGLYPGGWFQIAVEEKASGRLVGDCGVLVRKGEPRQAITGYTFARHAQGKGYATEAMTAVLDYAFGFDIHRFIADALAVNVRSIKLMERLGFRPEGYFREAEWFEGEWADNVVYGILKEEWQARRQATP